MKNLKEEKKTIPNDPTPRHLFATIDFRKSLFHDICGKSSALKRTTLDSAKYKKKIFAFLKS